MDLKYKDVFVTFAEVPDEIALCINITGCNIQCPDCHSKFLWPDKGDELNQDVLRNLIEQNTGITCVCFMGDGPNIYTQQEIQQLARWIKINTKLKVCWYSGRSVIPQTQLFPKYFDYFKVGPYLKDKGGLDSPLTNQRFYAVVDEIQYLNTNGPQDAIEYLYTLKDLTYKFRKNGTEDKLV
jgi:anaerobic ribonucleoside-triphosphate reductase activating protein